MSFEDSEDKVRRNLVVYCSTILALHYLGVEADLAITQILPSVIKVNEPEKIRTISCIVFLYLLYRYFASKKFKDAWRALKSSWQMALDLDLRENLRSITEKILVGKSKFWLWFYKGHLQATFATPIFIENVKLSNITNFNWTPNKKIRNFYARSFLKGTSYDIDIKIQINDGQGSYQGDIFRPGIEMRQSTENNHYHVRAEGVIINPSKLNFVFITIPKAIFKHFFSWDFSEISIPIFLLLATTWVFISNFLDSIFLHVCC